MEKKYYYIKNGEQQGPLTLDELKGVGITKEVLVWAEGMAQWQQAQYVADLKEVIPPTPPQAPHSASTGDSQNVTGPTYPPKTWLVESILATLFCCLPFGIVGIVNATRVESLYDKGNYSAAEQASADAKRWTIISFFVAIGVWCCYFILMLALVLV